MNSIEILLLKIGLSWTAAKIIPYLFFILFGILISLFFFKNKTSKKKFIFRLLIAFIPFIIYFVFSPIYEGDFSNAPYSTSFQKIDEFKNSEFVIVAIPGCPYCLESIQKINLLKKRNPKLKIEFLVCTSDENDLKDYKKSIDNSIPVKKTIKTKTILKVANNGFPTFLKIKNGIIQKAWSNDSFGVRALDEIEKNHR